MAVPSDGCLTRLTAWVAGGLGFPGHAGIARLVARFGWGLGGGKEAR